MTFLVAASMWSCQVMFSLRSLMTCSLYLQLTNLHQVGSRVGRLPQNHFQIIFKLKFERTISSAYRNILFRFNFIFIHSHCLQYTNTVTCITQVNIWKIMYTYANFINTMSLITFADPSKHFKFSLLSTFATLCKLVGNSKFACFYIGSKRCAEKQICSLICLVCKWASKKHICILICFMGKCQEYS